MKYFYAKGKRKTAMAAVRLYDKGKGNVTVNNKPMNEYFPVETDRNALFSPLKITKLIKNFDITVRVEGGGIHAQAEAIRHGISRALLEFNPELRLTLKRAGFLTRDSRMKERKKYGLKRARRAPQWQKR
ncbi:30S ribosomal protein S9 [Candidatus Peregrinibacteria bacterium]|nr:30S ribosomal protein S9 [Candidatus Peregrinibacteria bacterium]